MNRFRRAPEGSSRASRGCSGENTKQQPTAPSSTSAGPSERSTGSSKSPSFAEPASASFIQSIIHRQPSSANTTTAKPIQRGGAFSDGSPAVDGISGTSAKPKTGFFDKRSHLGFPCHSYDTSGGPFGSLNGGGVASTKTRGVYPTEVSPSVSNTSQPYPPRLPLTPAPNDATSSSARAATSVDPPHPEPPTTPRFLRGKSVSSSPPRPGKRMLSPMTDCSAAASENCSEDGMDGETSELEGNDLFSDDIHNATMIGAHGRTDEARLGVVQAGAVPVAKGATQGPGNNGGRVATTRKPCHVPKTRQTPGGSGSIEGNHLGKPLSEKEEHTKAGCRRGISANEPPGSTKSNDDDRAACLPHQLDRIAEEYDPFDDLSAAEDASFAKAAASIRELKHRQLSIRETIARSHSRLLQGDKGIKMMADLDDLSAKASNLLDDMKLEAPAPSQSDAHRREASRKDQHNKQLPRHQEGGPCQTRAQSPLATEPLLFENGSRPSKRGTTNQPETALLPVMNSDTGRRDAMDTSG